MAAVTFLGESFSFINGVGLVVLIMGVALFNYSKYQKILTGQAAPGSRKPVPATAKDGLNDEESARLVNGGPRLSLGAACTSCLAVTCGAQHSASVKRCNSTHDLLVHSIVHLLP